MEALELEITGAVTGGYGLARSQAGVVLVAGAIPGERVLARTVRKTRSWTLAEVRKILTPSPDRIKAPCPVYGRCGGCDWMHISPSAQVRLKEDILRDNLRRLGRVTVSLDSSLTGLSLEYRHRSRLHLSRGTGVGFRARRSHDIVGIRDCPVECARLRQLIRDLQGMTPSIRKPFQMHASSDGAEVAVQVLDWPGGSLEKLREVTGAAGIQAGARRVGNPRVTMNLSGLSYEVRAGRFFQSNWDLNVRLVKTVCGMIPAEARVVDLYAGAGNFALPLAARGCDVTAVEGVSGLVEDGLKNAALNGLDRIRYVKADLEKGPVRLQSGVDVVVADPPRSGMSRAVVDWLIRQPPPMLVYVSCDPATFSRDIGHLTAALDVDSVNVIDFFPQTSHIESMAVLRRRPKTAGGEKVRRCAGPVNKERGRMRL